MLVALCSVHAGGSVSSPAPELGGYLAAAATAGQWLTFAVARAQVRRDGGGGSEAQVEDRAGTGWRGQRDRRGRAGRQAGGRWPWLTLFSGLCASLMSFKG